MMRFIVPILLVGAAIGLFVVYTDPAYQTVKDLSARAASYDEALDKAQELRATRDALLSKRNTFKPDDISRLERALPDNVDNIRLVIDINNIASRRGLSLKTILVGEVSDSSASRSPLAAGASGDSLGSVDVGFTITATYEDFLAFLQDLEHSLRIVDVESIDFIAGEG